MKTKPLAPAIRSSFKRKARKCVSFADDAGQNLVSIRNFSTNEDNSNDYILNNDECNFEDSIKMFNQMNLDSRQLNEEKNNCTSMCNDRNVNDIPNSKASTSATFMNIKIERESHFRKISKIRDDTRYFYSTNSEMSSWIFLFDTATLNYDPYKDFIKLTKIELEDEDGIRKLKGIITVRNVAFEKFVFIRYTCHDWNTSIDYHAHFKKHNEVENSDEFSFCFPIYIGIVKPNKIFFAICMHAGNGNDYWDNNNNQNYGLQYLFSPLIGKFKNTQK